MAQSSVSSLSIKRVTAEQVVDADDLLAVEEPLEIRLRYQGPSGTVVKNISVTMRTPGHDEDLAVGFLFTEGIIKQFSDVVSTARPGVDGNSIVVELNDQLEFDLKKLERHFYTSSSCGVCGKSSIDAVRTVSGLPSTVSGFTVNASLLHTLPGLLREQQNVFESTGGLHASALFDASGKLILLREDVGRHNALDKLIGAALEMKVVPLSERLLLLSGRASFELIQKAAMAGIQMVAAVGAPSSLAVELAKEFDMTLTGFLRNNRFNIYCGEDRIVIGSEPQRFAE